MDSMGIDIQAVSPVPLQYYYALDPDLGRTSSRLINDHIAETVAAHPDRFVGLCTVPLQDPEMAVTELDRAVKELGMRGVEICTNVAGDELSDARFRKFFAKAEELDVLIFLHPNGFSGGERLSDHYFTNVIGNPLDSTVAVSHLIFGGVLDAYPKLKICVAHGGGYLAAYSGRIDHAHANREDCRRCIQEPPTSYLRKLYFDTVVFTEHQLEYLVSLYGSDHMVLGTDYPFDMGMYDPVGFVDGRDALTAGDKAAIVGGNAARLLGISERQPES
jgi:aminocarboxymuconate-semialdehyde decarboxylase